jgi:hypothetical protein
MQIGAADAGAAHADQDVVDAVRGLGDIFEPQAGLVAAFDQCFQAETSLAL